MSYIKLLVGSSPFRRKGNLEKLGVFRCWLEQQLGRVSVGVARRPGDPTGWDGGLRQRAVWAVDAEAFTGPGQSSTALARLGEVLGEEDPEPKLRAPLV